MSNKTNGAILDDKSVLRRLRAMLALANDARKPLAEIGKEYKASYQQRFVAMAEPDGRPWLELSAAYLAVKTQNRDKILTLTGSMSENLQIQVEANKLTATNKEKYAWLHQEGGKTIYGYTPARPHQGWSKENQQAVIGVFYRAILERAYGVKIEDLKYG